MIPLSFRALLGFVLVALLINCTPAKDRVLIIGDSISIGYTPYVKELLADRADVFHNPGNAQHTGTGLAKIDKWIGTEDWDIIQFNWGLWDLCYRHPDAKVYGNRDKESGTITYTVEEYATNLDSLITILKSTTDATLIFVTTSYIPAGEAGRFSSDAQKYNDVAKELMQQHGVVVNDIYVASALIHQQHGIGVDDVHYTDEGYKELGEIVADFIERH